MQWVHALASTYNSWDNIEVFFNRLIFGDGCHRKDRHKLLLSKIQIPKRRFYVFGGVFSECHSF